MIDQYFNRFKYKLGEMENPQEYVEKYGEAYEFVLKDEVHRRYYEGIIELYIDSWEEENCICIMGRISAMKPI